MRLSFSSPVPLLQGCKVSYWFPSAFFNAALIESVRTGSLFSLTSETFYSATSGRSSKVFTLKDEADGYRSVTFATCPGFRSQEAPETSLIVGLRLPTSTQESKSVKVFIYDSTGTLVTFADHGLTFAATSGSLEIVSAIHSPTVVSSLSYFSWSIKPSHSLSQTDNPVVKIQFPPEFKVQHFCDKPSTCTSNQVENSLSVTNLINDKLLGGETINLIVGPLKLPISVAQTNGMFKVTTYVKGAGSEELFTVDAGQK
jgi:hypothetical protein